VTGWGDWACAAAQVSALTTPTDRYRRDMKLLEKMKKEDAPDCVVADQHVSISNSLDEMLQCHGLRCRIATR